MAYNLGDIVKNDTVYCYFSTHEAAGGNVAPSTAFESADVIVYEDGSATQITAGVTVTSPFDAETGFHLATIATTDSSYETGKSYTVVLAPDETIDGQTITAVVIGYFTIERGAAHRELGASGAGLTAIPWNASWDAEVQSEVTDGLNAYDPPTRAELTADKDEILNAVGILTAGTMQAGSLSTTAVLASATTIGDDILNATAITIVAGTGLGQTRYITDWVSATDTATVAPAWSTTPDNTSVYVVRALFPANTSQINSARVIGDGNVTPWDGE